MKKQFIKSATVIIAVFLFAMIIALGSQPIAGAAVETPNITDFDVSEADIRDVLRSLAELGDINILLDPAVKGNVTIKLKHGMPIKEALEMVVQTYGFSYRWVTANRTFIVGNEKTFVNFEVMETRTYRLAYGQADQIADQLKIMVKDGISADNRTNQLTIKASLLQHQNILEVISRLDREMPQLSIEARIEEISKTASKKLGLTYDWGDGTNSGLNFKLTTFVTLEAMESQNQAKLLARPNIAVTDSQEGKIFIGDKLPIITSSQTDKGVTYSYSYIEVGTKLTVTPRINENDTVTVTVRAESSTIYGWKTAGSAMDIPLIRTREASSVVRLREGETFILSGLNLSRSSLTTEQVPGLSKIPIFGNLFKRRINDPQLEETELVIFITPRILKVRPVATPTPLPAATISPAVTPSSVIPLTVPSPSAVQPEPTPTPTPTPTPALSPIPSASAIASPAGSIVPEQPSASPGASGTPVPAGSPSPGASVSLSPSLAPSVSPGASIAATPAPTAAAIPETAGLKISRIVKAGETVASVAKKYGITAESIFEANSLKSDAKLTAGKSIILPIPKNHLYQIKPKETLWRIAKRYGVTLELLQELNGIKDPTKISSGQTIILPCPVDKIADNTF